MEKASTVKHWCGPKRRPVAMIADADTVSRNAVARALVSRGSRVVSVSRAASSAEVATVVAELLSSRADGIA